VDLTGYDLTRGEEALEDMDDRSVLFAIDDVENPDAADRAEIVWLSARRRVERGSIQDGVRAPVRQRPALGHGAGEGREVCVGIIETRDHFKKPSTRSNFQLPTPQSDFSA